MDRVGKEAERGRDEILRPVCGRRWCTDRRRRCGLGVDAQTGASTAIATASGGEGVPAKGFTVLVLEAPMSRSGRGDRFGIEGSG